MSYPVLIENLISSFSKLPGVGRRSAERMAFWVLNRPKEDSVNLAENILKLKDGLMFCRICHHLTDEEVCFLCRDGARDQATICVVEDPKDVFAIEKAGAYKGQYHVLHGTISPPDGRGPEHLTIDKLLKRVSDQGIQEVVIATDADSDGEMTALYLIKQLKEFNVQVSRIGMGIPVGGAVEFADISSLSVALESRRKVE